MISFDAIAVPSQEITKLRHAIVDVQGWLNTKLASGRCSWGFILELACHQVARHYDVHRIYDEIGILEGTSTKLSITKPPEPFKREPLLGLWHKHHFQTAFIPRNLRNEMRRPGAMQNALRPFFGSYVGVVAAELANAMTIKPYEARAGRCHMTGEWIVYEKEAAGNYYLTLGRHDEPHVIVRARVEANRGFDRVLESSKQRR